MGMEWPKSGKKTESDVENRESGDTLKELGTYLPLIKEDAKQWAGWENNVPATPYTRDVVGSNGIIDALREKGITADNNELVTGYVEYSEARKRLNRAISETSSRSESEVEDKQLREDFDNATQNLNKLIAKWEPLLTGAF